MTHQPSPSAKSAMIAPRLYLSLVATLFAITGIMFAPQNAAAHDYHKHGKSNVAIQFQFGGPVASSRIVNRQHYHAPKYKKKRFTRAVVHTCSPNKAKHIARNHYGLRYAKIISVNRSNIVIVGKRRGHVKRIAFGHYCQLLRH